MNYFKYILFALPLLSGTVAANNLNNSAIENGDSIDKLKLIAHRGLWSQGFPQNSKDGIAAALESDLGGYECDIRQTADGFIILNHDMEVDDRDIDKSSLSELTKIASPNTLPLLSEILEMQSLYPDKIMYAEIKSGNVEDILEIFSKYGIDKNVIFKSFDKEICKELIPRTSMPVYLLSVDNNLDFQGLKNEGFAGVSLMFQEDASTKDLIDRIHATGLNCAFWTINDLDIAKKLNDWEADHIVSDLPFLNNL